MDTLHISKQFIDSLGILCMQIVANFVFATLFLHLCLCNAFLWSVVVAALHLVRQSMPFRNQNLHPECPKCTNTTVIPLELTIIKQAPNANSSNKIGSSIYTQQRNLQAKAIISQSCSIITPAPCIQQPQPPRCPQTSERSSNEKNQASDPFHPLDFPYNVSSTCRADQVPAEIFPNRQSCQHSPRPQSKRERERCPFG